MRLLGLLLASPLLGQAPAPAVAVVPRPGVSAALHEALGATEPGLRGTAALALATRRDPADYGPILAVARDRALEARLRGVLALGVLAAPGCESFLGELLLDHDRALAERAAAAYALGLLPDEHGAPAIDAYLRQVTSGSYRRHRETLAALLLGLASSPHPSRAAALRALVLDRSNREPGLRRLALRALAAMPEAVARADGLAVLRSDDAGERVAALRLMLVGQGELGVKDRERVRVLAIKDRSPAVRSAALTLLAGLRDLAGLELGVRALRSRDPDECATGVRATLELGGGAIRLATEACLLAASDPAVQAAMLAALERTTNPELLDGCLRSAADRSAPLAVRVEAAALAGRSGDRRAAVPLRSLFRECAVPEQLLTLARAAMTLDPACLGLEGIYPPANAEELRGLPPRLWALLVAGSPDAPAVLEHVLRAGLGAQTTVAALRPLWRAAVGDAEPADLAPLPPELADVLR